MSAATPKRRLRRYLTQSPTLALAAARTFATLSAFAALRWRVTVWFRASVDRTAKVIGWKHIAIGRNVVVGARTWLNVNHRGANGITLTLGDNAYIGCENFFSVGRSIRIGEYVLTTSRCAFIGSSHIYSHPMSHYAGTSTTDDAVIDVGVNCFVGFGVTVLGNVRIGHGCIIGAHSVVRADVPPFSLAVGSPARVTRHYDFAVGRWVDGGRPSGQTVPTEEDYLASIRASAGFAIQPISAAAATFGDI